MRHSGSKGRILVTGGAGYIGSTVCSALLDAGWTPIILDNLCQGRREFTEGRVFYEGDIADRSLIQKIVREQGSIFATIHCAALIVVPESVTEPESYYRENVSKSVELFASLRDSGCQRIVFSSSAAIYDTVKDFKVDEEAPLRPLSPYARTKFMMEMVLRDFCDAYKMRGIALRYFNPIGADPALRTGTYVEAPTHVLGRMVSVALGKSPLFEITGIDWPTRDGSGIRDYIHVWDLARAHVKAVECFEQAFDSVNPQYRVINLGTGNGVTVKELVLAFESAYGKPLNKREIGPRPGDVAGSYASCDLARSLIDWRAELSVEQGIIDALRWTEAWGLKKKL
jgi:UDP-glucose 4-epimerase